MDLPLINVIARLANAFASRELEGTSAISVPEATLARLLTVTRAASASTTGMTS